MKRQFSLLVLLLLLFLPVKVLNASSPIDDQEGVPIPIVDPSLGEPKGGNAIPISCYYDLSDNEFVFFFEYDIGLVCISINNSYVGVELQEVFNTQLGYASIPIEGVEGLYNIVIETIGGKYYYGDFQL